jgi:hypothetical protein
MFKYTFNLENFRIEIDYDEFNPKVIEVKKINLKTNSYERRIYVDITNLIR